MRRYIRESTQNAQEVFLPLAFGPVEEAQVDRHEGLIEENGVLRKAWFSCVRFCFSKAAFA